MTVEQVKELTIIPEIAVTPEQRTEAAKRASQWFLESTGLQEIDESPTYEGTARYLERLIDDGERVVPDPVELAKDLDLILTHREVIESPDGPQLRQHFLQLLKGYFYVTRDLNSAINVIFEASGLIVDAAKKNGSTHPATAKAKDGLGENPYLVVATELTHFFETHIPNGFAAALCIAPDTEDPENNTGMKIVAIPVRPEFLEADNLTETQTMP